MKSSTIRLISFTLFGLLINAFSDLSGQTSPRSETAATTAQMSGTRYYDASGRLAVRVEENRFFDMRGIPIGRQEGDRVYNGSGTLIGRIQAGKIFNGMGIPIGITDGTRLHDGSGRLVGRIEGNRVYSNKGRLVLRSESIERQSTIIVFYFFITQQANSLMQ